MAKEWPETGYCQVLKCHTQVLVLFESINNAQKWADEEDRMVQSHEEET